MRTGRRHGILILIALCVGLFGVHTKAVAAQTVGSHRLTPRLGAVLSSTMPRVIPDGDDGAFEADGYRTAFLVGVAWEFTTAGRWSIEGRVSGTVGGSVASVHRCGGACLAIYETPTLGLSTVQFAMTVSPPGPSEGLRFRVGVGVDRTTASWAGGTNFGGGARVSDGLSYLAGATLRTGRWRRRLELDFLGSLTEPAWGTGSWRPRMSVAVGMGFLLGANFVGAG